MKNLYLLMAAVAILFASSCASSKQHTAATSDWQSAAKMEDSEIFVDVASIKRVGTLLVAREKKVFYTAESKNAYVANIRNRYATLGKAEKADKWADFSYTIYTTEYDCVNSRQRVLGVEDYDSQGVRIIKTPWDKKTDKWKNVDRETIGDYTFFFVCDYED